MVYVLFTHNFEYGGVVHSVHNTSESARKTLKSLIDEETENGSTVEWHNENHATTEDDNGECEYEITEHEIMG